METMQESAEVRSPIVADDGWTDERLSELIGDFFAALDSLDVGAGLNGNSGLPIAEKAIGHSNGGAVDGRARSGLRRLFSRG